MLRWLVGSAPRGLLAGVAVFANTAVPLRLPTLLYTFWPTSHHAEVLATLGRTHDREGAVLLCTSGTAGWIWQCCSHYCPVGLAHNILKAAVLV